MDPLGYVIFGVPLFLLTLVVIAVPIAKRLDRRLAERKSGKTRLR